MEERQAADTFEWKYKLHAASSSGLNVTFQCSRLYIDFGDKPNPTSTAAMWMPAASLLPTPPCYPIIVLWENKLPQLKKGLKVINRFHLSNSPKSLFPWAFLSQRLRWSHNFLG